MSIRVRRPARPILLPAAAILVVAGVAATSWWLLRPSEHVRATVVQEGLEHPWDIAFADDGRMLVTERIGRIRVYAGPEPGAEWLHTATIPDVRAELESGLMGIAVRDDLAFVCATRGDPDPASWQVQLLGARLLPDGSLSPFVLLPIGPVVGAPRHQGCAVEVDGAGDVWMTVGDANLPVGENRAQDPIARNGKVLRVHPDGSVPADNPFAPDSPAYSLGHRNPQGLAFGPDGMVVAVEHGTDENDEINVIEPGGNYGYPCFTGAEDVGPITDGCGPASDYLPPAWASGSPTLATSGITFLTGSAWGDWEGDLVVTTLKQEDLRRFTVADDGSIAEAQTLLDGRFGRLRAAVIGPDGALYLSTANGDDRIIRVEPAVPGTQIPEGLVAERVVSTEAKRRRTAPMDGIGRLVTSTRLTNTSANPAISSGPTDSDRTIAPQVMPNAGTMNVTVLATVGVVCERTRKKIGQASAVDRVATPMRATRPSVPTAPGGPDRMANGSSRSAPLVSWPVASSMPLTPGRWRRMKVPPIA